MALRVVGAGLGRTGTNSLKVALERLLGSPCYHMFEILFEHGEHIPVWRRALQGDLPDWNAFLAGYVATVDWPAASFWPELAAANPDALVLLSLRESPEAWWRSADRTILEAARRTPRPGGDPVAAGVHDLFIECMEARFTDRWRDPDEITAAYQRHNVTVRRAVPPERLIEWRTGDGWGPLCRALGVPVPDEPFPHLNTTRQFRVMARFDPLPSRWTPPSPRAET